MDSAVRSLYTNPQRVCMEMGTDYYENVELQKKALEYAERFGSTTSWSIPGVIDHGENMAETLMSASRLRGTKDIFMVQYESV